VRHVYALHPFLQVLFCALQAFLPAFVLARFMQSVWLDLQASLQCGGAFAPGLREERANIEERIAWSIL
jgi:hypothetical protein